MSNPRVCFYFLLHQPMRLDNVSVFNLGLNSDYFNLQDKNNQNRQVFLKVAKKSYLPMLTLLLDLVKKHPHFCFSFSASGVFLEQAQLWQPKLITLLKKLLAHDQQVELVAENYYHSLSFLYSTSQFQSQVREYLKLVWKLFKVRPKTFRNTELIYSNTIAAQVQKLGFDLTFAEGVDRYLQGRPKTQLFRANIPDPQLYLLLKHAEFSDDIAFRFSNKGWGEHPLTADKYIAWLDQYSPQDFINLFMDFETFGEHQWADTGIFEFFADFVAKHKSFTTPTAAKKLALDGLVKMELSPDALPVYDVPVPISWADQERDLSAWLDNDLQKDALQKLFVLEKKILSTKDTHLIKDWQYLTTSDHFYYMCTKYFSDGDVHAYFNAYQSPLEAYRRFCIVLADLDGRLSSLS